AVTGGKKGFVNFTRNTLLAMPEFDPRFIVIEVLETVEPDEAVIDAVRAAVDAGFIVALDDFSYDDKWIPLLQMVHIVKVDVIEHKGDRLTALCNKLRGYSVELLAEKVESYEVFDECRRLGFS